MSDVLLGFIMYTAGMVIGFGFGWIARGRKENQ